MAALLTRASVKTRLGLESDDDTYDVAIDAALPLVTEWFEAYCDRGLAQRTVTDEDIFNNASRRVYVWCFPLTTLTTVKVDGESVDGTAYNVAKNQGYFFPGSSRPSVEFAEHMQVTYTGGYAQNAVPEDLAQAFALAVGTQASVAGVSTSSSSSAIKSIGLGSGALSVAFDTAAQQGGITGAFDVSGVPVEVQNSASVLNRYVRMRA